MNIQTRTLRRLMPVAAAAAVALSAAACSSAGNSASAVAGKSSGQGAIGFAQANFEGQGDAGA